MPDQAFRGRGAKGFNWEHIIERHAPEGSVAQQRLRENPDYIIAIFENMTENQIKGCVQRGWTNRERVDTQEDLITEVIRVKYRGVDPETGYRLEMWQNQSTGIIETAYPIAK